MDAGRFPDGLAVLTPYPVTDAEAAGDRASWPFVPATIVSQCGPDEWELTVETPAAARLEDGRPAPAGTPHDEIFWPVVFRDSSEIRPADPAAEEPREIFSGGFMP
jgi:hypothetical protein